MKRFISMLAILLVVLVAGLSALVLLVNPNDFRDYMVQEVEQRSGYQLTFNGDLRWHVWPQLSILSGPITLTAPGATQPLIKAGNMRLDVHLLPLLSHQLSVSQVMLKEAVITLTPESEEKRLQRAPVAPRDSRVAEKREGWKFDIAQLQVTDSLVVWQQANGEQLNFRDVNLRFSQPAGKQAQIELQSRISRDQQELALQAKGDVDLSHYPQQLAGSLNALSFQLTGADLPASGINGQLSVNATWLPPDEKLALKNLVVTVNDSTLQGEMEAQFSSRPQIKLALQAPVLDLDTLSGITASVQRSADEPRNPPRPVISQPVSFNPQESLFNHIDGSLTLQVGQLRFHDTELQNLAFNALANQGIVEIQSLTASMDKGTISLPGELDFRKTNVAVRVYPEIKTVPVIPLLALLKLPPVTTGDLSLKGEFQGAGIMPDEMQQHWQGEAQLTLDGAELRGINFQQMIQRALTRSSDRFQDNDQSSTLFRQNITSQLRLDNGNLVLSNLRGQTPMLNYTGAGDIDLQKQSMDMAFNFILTDGWRGDSELIHWLQQTAIPLRIYGEWSALNYSLQIDKLLRQYLQNEAKNRLREWVGNSEKRDEKAAVEKLLKAL